MNEEKKTGLDALVQEAAKFRAAERDLHLQLEEHAGKVVEWADRICGVGEAGWSDVAEVLDLIVKMRPAIDWLATMKESPRTAAALDLTPAKLVSVRRASDADPLDAARFAVMSAGGSDAIIDAIEAYDRALWSQLEERFG